MGLYLALLGVVLARIFAVDGGRQIYLLDDPYIHLAIAKNLLLHGVYGISATEPAMASSSIVWPYLLMVAAKLTGGVWVVLPLALNILCAVGLLGMAHSVLRRLGVNEVWTQTAGLVLLVLGLPLVSVTLVGMEHLLFALAFLLFLWLAGDATSPRPQPGWALAVAAMLLTGSRFEGVFAVFVACLVLARRRPLLAVSTAVAGAAPVLAFALFSLRRGGMWLPNSVVLKTAGGGAFAAHLRNAVANLSAPMVWKSGLGELIVLAAWLTWQERRRPSARRTMLWVYLGTVLLHGLLASLVSGTTRYDAYLTGAGLVLAFASFAGPERGAASSLRERRIAQGVAVLTLLPVLGYRGLWLEFSSARSAASIYRQQYQAARFFADYYRGQAIVANDIGALSYFAEAPVFDLNGLGNNDTARIINGGGFGTAAIDRLARERGVRVGVLYGDHYNGSWALPAQWIKVRSWEIPNPRGTTVSEPVIDFYATSPEEAGRLLGRLREFEPMLPREVTVLPVLR